MGALVTPKSRPLLMRYELVRSSLDDIKNQTRRVIALREFGVSDTHGYDFHFRDKALRWHDYKAERFIARFCPYGVVGDRLYVREVFSPFARNGVRCKPSEATYVVLKDGTQVYRDGTLVPGLAEYAPGAFDHIKWCPSIHMPRWASRLTLELTAVRVQRVQEISGEDARAEGVSLTVTTQDCPPGKCKPLMPLAGKHPPYDYSDKHPRDWTEDDWYRTHFASLWDGINGNREGCSWAANPFVWAISFKRIAP